MARAKRSMSANCAPRGERGVLRRGVVYENTSRFALAEADYRAVIAAAPSDPSAW